MNKLTDAPSLSMVPTVTIPDSDAPASDVTAIHLRIMSIRTSPVLGNKTALRDRTSGRYVCLKGLLREDIYQWSIDIARGTAEHTFTGRLESGLCFVTWICPGLQENGQI